MKKQIVILAVIFATMLASCVPNQNSYSDVTVFQKHKNTGFDKFDDAMIGKTLRYDAIASSGDTIVVHVDDAIVVAKALPYKARMRKHSTLDHGFIEVDGQAGDFLKKP